MVFKSSYFSFVYNSKQNLTEKNATAPKVVKTGSGVGLWNPSLSIHKAQVCLQSKTSQNICSMKTSRAGSG